MHLKFPLFLYGSRHICVFMTSQPPNYTCVYAKMKQVNLKNNFHSIFMYMSNITIKDHLNKKFCDYMLK